jgi:hypothetical protein
MTWAYHGHATFQYGDEIHSGQPHIIWRPSALTKPQGAFLSDLAARRHCTSSYQARKELVKAGDARSLKGDRDRKRIEPRPFILKSSSRTEAMRLTRSAGLTAIVESHR